MIVILQITPQMRIVCYIELREQEGIDITTQTKKRPKTKSKKLINRTIYDMCQLLKIDITEKMNFYN